MNAVSTERLPLIERWNDKPILLPAGQRAVLAAIGETPPDLYGNGRQYRETPCAVTTVKGEKIDTAIVSVQCHAPFEEWRDYRLASEIAEIAPSPHALPLDVRIACSKAEETHMGFSPTTVELPNGQAVVLNGTPSFFVGGNINAAQIKLSPKAGRGELPPIHQGTDKIVYFVADPEPGDE